MKKRNPFFVAIMAFITVFIYWIYWLVSTKNEMNKKGAKIPTVFLALAPLLGLVLIAVLQIVARFVLNSASSDQYTDVAASPALTVINVLSVLLGFTAVIAIIPAAIYWFYKYSLGVVHVTKNKTGLDLVFWLGLGAGLIGLNFLWAGFIQTRFNEQVK